MDVVPATIISGGVQLVNGVSFGSKIENGGMGIICRGAKTYDTVINDGIQHVNGYAFRSISDRKLEPNKNVIKNTYSTSYALFKVDDTLTYCVKIGK
ncbi:MAG: hypothetical protein Nk1A_5790 [Endomicrobiia bacterium]|nr:MAG: hypothetical protein Nk1A_5790 [Endomicrobiia bacterium]